MVDVVEKGVISDRSKGKHFVRSSSQDNNYVDYSNVQHQYFARTSGSIHLLFHLFTMMLIPRLS